MTEDERLEAWAIHIKEIADVSEGDMACTVRALLDVPDGQRMLRRRSLEAIKHVADERPDHKFYSMMCERALSGEAPPPA